MVAEASFDPVSTCDICLVYQAAADLKASADSSKDHEDDEETDQSQAQEMKQDDSEEEDSYEGKRILQGVAQISFTFLRHCRLEIRL